MNLNKIVIINQSGCFLIGFILVLLLIGSCKKNPDKKNAVNQEPIPESYINRDKKVGLPNEPDESASLPFCQDSSEIPKYKKRFCSLKILSNKLITGHPQWKAAVGVIYLSLTIDSDSTLSEVKLTEDFSGKKIGEEVAQSCFNYLKNYKCIPAKKNGFRIKSKLVIPIYFGLDLLDKDVVE